MAFLEKSPLGTIAALRTWRQTKAVDAFGAYDDYPSGARIFGLCRSLAACLAPQCRLRQKAWPFAEFLSSKLGAEAAREAAAADLVIVSSRWRDVLPVELVNWFDLWPISRALRPRVLCAILDSFETKNLSAREFLEGTAQKHGMEFVILDKELLAMA